MSGQTWPSNYPDRVWNRAALQGGGPERRHGDQMLSAMVLAHSLISNGGVLHALEVLDDREWKAAVHGYRYFGFNDVADLLFRASQIPLDDRTEAWEIDLDKEYGAYMPSDEVFDAPFRRKLRGSPEDFAPDPSN